MQNTPKNNGVQPPLLPRAILGGAILPFFLSEPLTPAQITIERLAFAAEVEATRPAWQIALAGALAALGGAA